MKTRLLSPWIGFIALAGSALPLLADAAEFLVPLHTEVTEYRPVPIYSGPPRSFTQIDHNWVGARGREGKKAYLIADGRIIWSGIIPPYDPTFTWSSPDGSSFSNIELRMESGVASVRWAKLYGAHHPIPSPPYPGGCQAGQRCRLEFIGSEMEAYKLARETVRIINHLQAEGLVFPGCFNPLKLNAMEVFAIDKANHGQHKGDTTAAVLNLEAEFAAQEATINGLAIRPIAQEDALALKTIRVRFKALFGRSTY